MKRVDVYMLSENVPNVTVVIVNYNAGHWLLLSVASALSQASRVIVVDNASVDTSIALLEEQYSQDVRVVVIRSEKNQGFATACNQGAAVANTPFIFFLNPDCVLKPYAITALTYTMQSDPKIGMAGGLLTDENGIEQRSGRRLIPTVSSALIQLLGLSRYFCDFNLHKEPLPSAPVEVEAISGAMMFVRREAFYAVDGFDEGYFLHCEDLDICMRFHLAKWKIVFVPEAVTMHGRGICSRSRRIFVSWNKHRGMFRFYCKFFHPRFSWLATGCVAIGIYVHFALIVVRHFIVGFLPRLVRRKHAG